MTDFGVRKTGGAVGGLQTSGFYRFSRNPQYVADIGTLHGWMMHSAAPLALLVGVSAIIVLVAVPFFEDPWLRAQ